MAPETRRVDAIRYREELYPRPETNPALVQEYARDIDLLPPIEVNQNDELIDGWHRWTAHKKVGREEIAVTVVQTQGDLDALVEAGSRNRAPGWGLVDSGTKNVAIRAYQRGAGWKAEHAARHDENEPARLARVKRELAAKLKVSEQTLTGYLADIDQDIRKERRDTVFDLWLACHTQEQISERAGLSIGAVNEIIRELSDLSHASKVKVLSAQHEDDFAVPLYDMWTADRNRNETKHFGNTPVEFVDNLLYTFTEPFDIVIDPFGGGGSTIDVCKKRLRRYWVSDRKPIPERPDIREHDVTTDGVSGPSRWADVALVYLDPPYWKQAAGKYSDDPTDLANMPLEGFNEAMVRLLNGYADKLKAGAHVALIIAPTQWPNEGHETVYHDIEIAGLVGKKLKLVRRAVCPYSTQQYNGTMVDEAKRDKLWLVLSRTMLVWERV